jgi:TonB family protein
MSRKIKLHTFNALFQLFAYLADRTGGWRVFVRPKLLLGSLIMGLGLASNMPINAQKQSRKTITNSTSRNKTNNKTPKTIQSTDEDPIYEVVDQMPQFPGGDGALMAFIEKNKTSYPLVAQCYNGIEGKAICRFIVEKDGSLSDIKIIRSFDTDFDNDALRIIKLLPKFTPGKKNGKVVRTYYTIPIIHRITD